MAVPALDWGGGTGLGLIKGKKVMVARRQGRMTDSTERETIFSRCKIFPFLFVPEKDLPALNSEKYTSTFAKNTLFKITPSFLL